jgi:hypothetical protein
LMPSSVCSATIALAFVRMLDIGFSFRPGWLCHRVDRAGARLRVATGPF